MPEFEKKLELLSNNNLWVHGERISNAKEKVKRDEADLPIQEA